MSLVSPAFISHCSPVQGKMAGSSANVYEFDRVVRGQHVYKVHGLQLCKKYVNPSCRKTMNMLNTL